MSSLRLHRSASLFFGLFVAASAASADQPRLEATAAGFSSYLLPNGFKIILAPFPAAANARVELLIKTGSKQEGYGETGMAHLLEHMLFKGAGQRADVKRDLTALGANWNGTTTADYTNFFETVAPDPKKVEEALRIEADRFIRARFTRQDLASEMTVVRNELERSDNSPGSLVMRALQRQAYFWHGYSRPTIGARSDIEGAPFAALKAFHKRHYRPDNAVLIVSGNFEPKRVLALAGQLFSVARNPASAKPAAWTREEARPITNRSELFLPAGRTMAASAWKLPGPTERQTYALDLALSAICAQEWGSLRKDLVLERKVAVGVSCGTQFQADYSLLVATATAGKDADAETLSQALREHIEKAAAVGISAEQLERSRRNEQNAFERLETSHEALVPFLAQAEVAGDWRLLFWQKDVIKAITADEANEALKKWVVAVNRSDVLLRHADNAVAPELPKGMAAAALVAGKEWPAIAKAADPIPASLRDLAKATVAISLDDPRARAALISRRTQGDRAWLIFGNDYGNEAALAGRRAACAMASHLMSYGGAGLSRDELSGRLEALQAEWSMGLDGIVLEAPRRHMAEAFEVLLAAWRTPTLPEDEFARVKAAAVARLEANLKDPGQVAAATAGLRFDNYPPQHPLQPRSLEQQLAENQAVTMADVQDCIADFGGLGQVRLALVGEFSPADVKSLWAKIGTSPTARVPYARVKDLLPPTDIDTSPITIAMPAKPNATVTGSAALAITDDSPDFPALRIAVKVLGGDSDSRVWQRLREREGLAYGAGVNLWANSFEPRSRISFQASAASDKADAALAGLREELARALKDGFSEQEVERAKTAWRQERQTSLRAEQSFAGMLAQGLYNGRDYAWLAAYDDRIARVTAAEATRALRKYLANTPLVWAIGRGN